MRKREFRWEVFKEQSETRRSDHTFYRMISSIYKHFYAKGRNYLRLNYDVCVLISKWLEINDTYDYNKFVKRFSFIIDKRGEARGFNNLEIRAYCYAGMKVKIQRLYTHVVLHKLNRANLSEEILDFVVYYLCYHKLI